MDKAEFLNRLRSLHCIDGYLLPQLTASQQLEFVRNPVRYFMQADKDQSDAIWRRIEGRQKTAIEPPPPDGWPCSHGVPASLRCSVCEQEMEDEE